MFDKLELLNMANAMAVHAGARQAAVARNVANADTPGYRAVDTASFAETYRDQAGDDALRTTRPGHVMDNQARADGPRLLEQSGNLSPNGNSVSLENEMVRAVEVRRQHDMALAIYRSATNVLRASIGRSR